MTQVLEATVDSDVGSVETPTGQEGWFRFTHIANNGMKYTSEAQFHGKLLLACARTLRRGQNVHLHGSTRRDGKFYVLDIHRG